MYTSLPTLTGHIAIDKGTKILKLKYWFCWKFTGMDRQPLYLFHIHSPLPCKYSLEWFDNHLLLKVLCIYMYRPSLSYPCHLQLQIINDFIMHFYFVGSGVSCGKTLQRFPENDWDDCPYTQGVELVSFIYLRDILLYFVNYCFFSI